VNNNTIAVGRRFLRERRAALIFRNRFSTLVAIPDPILIHQGADVKPSLILAASALASVLILSGCGNTRQLEASLAEKQSAVDSLQKVAGALSTENGKLKGRVSELEKSLNNSNARVIDLEKQIQEVRIELDQAKAKGGKGNLEGAYREALQKYMDRRYDDAIAAFETLLADGMPDPLNDNCHYWIGESLFGLRRYKEAAARFDEVLEFRWSNKKDDSQVMIARCYARMGDMARAKTEYQKLVDTYPASPYLDLAKGRIGS
jgi:TolA-binding protein